MIRNFSDWSTSLMVASFTNLPLVAHHSMRMKIGRHPKTLLSHSINAVQRCCQRPPSSIEPGHGPAASGQRPASQAAFCVNRISVDE